MSTADHNDPLEGFTPQGLQNYDIHFQDLITSQKIANVSTLLARNGKFVHRNAFGIHDLSSLTPRPVSSKSLYRIASMLKPLVAAGMMMLYESGHWSLTDPVSKHIPEFEGLKVALKNENGEVELAEQTTPMTMKQLMCHSAGFIGMGDSGYSPEELRKGDLKDMVNLLARMPLGFQPGKEWRYGPSVDIQGYIIEVITGQTLDHFLYERLFEPLGMVDTSWVVEEEKLPRVVRIHQLDQTNGTLVSVPLEGSYSRERPKFVGGGKNLLSTVDDYWRFCQMLLDNGSFKGKQYLQPSTIKLMTANALEPGVPVKFGTHVLKDISFGLGLAVVEKQEKVNSQPVGTYFWGGVWGTWFWIDPVNKVVAVGMVNEEGWARRMPSMREMAAKWTYEALKV